MRYLSFLALLAVAGCSVTGTDSKSQFGCLAPEGVQCMTASGVYYNSLSNNLPALKPVRPSAASDSPDSMPAKPVAAKTRPLDATVELHTSERAAVGKRAPDFSAAGAVRAVPRVMRVWILPWEDAEGDLHDQSYVYMTLDAGRWLIEHTRNAIQPHKLGGTTLLFGDTALASDASDAELGKSVFSRDLEKLAPAKPAANSP